MAVAGNITGPGGLQKIGPNLLFLSGTNTYGGNTTINAGTVQIGSPGALPSGSTNGAVYINGASTLDVNGNNVTVVGLSDDGTGNATIDNSSASPGSLANMTGLSFVGKVQNSGGGALSIINVSGPCQLLGINSYTGSNVVQGGTLEINIPTGTTTGGLLQVADNATLILHKTGPGSSLKAAGASFGTSGTPTLNIDLNNYVNPSAPVINATNGTGVLTVNGTVSVNLFNFANSYLGPDSAAQIHQPKPETAVLRCKSARRRPEPFRTMSPTNPLTWWCRSRSPRGLAIATMCGMPAPPTGSILGCIPITGHNGSFV